jgi:hypothetical protein
MKLILPLLMFILFSCQEASVFNEWSNIISSERGLSLKKGKQGINSKSFHANKDCHFDIEVKGKELAGKIAVIADSKVKKHCRDKIPTGMQYNTVGGDKLKVCSDYADGRHHCEMMKKAN